METNSDTRLACSLCGRKKSRRAALCRRCAMTKANRKVSDLATLAIGRTYTCFRCKRTLEAGMMRLNSQMVHGNQKSGECKECAVRRQRQPAALASRRNRKLLLRYGLTELEYCAALRRQGDVCAICKRSDRRGPFHVDHDHATGKLRGILCSRCNTCVEWMIEFQSRAANYLSGEWFAAQNMPEQRGSE